MEVKKNSLGEDSFLTVMIRVFSYIIVLVCFLSICTSLVICLTTNATEYILEFGRTIHTSFLEAGFSDKQATFTLGGFTIFYLFNYFIKLVLHSLEQRTLIAKTLLFLEKIELFFIRLTEQIKNFLLGASFLALITFLIFFGIFYSFYPEVAFSIFFPLY